MNRTLRRPMFRMGGSAEGITSGLQPRQGYQGTDNPSDQRVQPPRDRGLSDFLINMGLDLVSRPASGNIFQQIGASAKEPFKQFQAARAAGEETNDIAYQLEPNENTAEANQIDFWFTSSGFKLDGSGTYANGDGDTYFYMAFAEFPFVSSKGIPATAR